jgi:hypothetical protein
VNTIRKLVLGETWTLPLGVVVALAACGLLRLAAGDHGWWRHAGGFVLLGLTAAVLLVSVGRPRR